MGKSCLVGDALMGEVLCNLAGAEDCRAGFIIGDVVGAVDGICVCALSRDGDALSGMTMGLEVGSEDVENCAIGAVVVGAIDGGFIGKV